METTQTSVISPFLSATFCNTVAERQTTASGGSLFKSSVTPSGPDAEFFQPIQVISPELILVDWGPMTLTISVWADSQPRPVMAVQGAIRALELLESLAEDQPFLKIPSGRFKSLDQLPCLLNQVVSACQKVSSELTGMAGVAGIVADEIVQSVLALGGDRVIVNNGGDIAVGLGCNQKIRVGLKDPGEEKPSHILDILPEYGVGGIATSGWGGRSFSPGLADAVSVWAADCVTADAAATWIAGEMRFFPPKVVQCPAEELDPETDIPQLLVTRAVAPLTPEEKEAVLAAGISTARGLLEKGVIQGAFMAVQGMYRWIAFQEPFPESLNQTEKN